jgi:hypothetical protein
MAHSDDVKEYAKELYVSVDENGNKKHTLRQIAELIQQKTNKKINYTTIGQWADDGDWDKILLKAMQHGIKTAHKTSEEINTELIEEQGKDIAFLYGAAKTALEIGLKGVKALDENGELSETARVKLMEFGSKTMIALNDMCQKIQVDLSMKLAHNDASIRVIDDVIEAEAEVTE